MLKVHPLRMLALCAGLALLLLLPKSNNPFAKAPTTQPTKTKTTPKTTTKPSTKTQAVSKVELSWQIDMWETRFRAAWVAYVLLEWKKYTRDPKTSTQKAFAQVTRIRKEKPFFKLIKEAHTSLKKPSTLKRRVDFLYEQLKEYHLSKKIDVLRKRIHVLTDKLNGVQASFRAVYQGKKMSNRDLSKLIRRHPQRSVREAAWRAYSSVGPKVLKGGFMKLVQARNAYARALGFKSFFHYRYHKLKLDPKAMWARYDALERATRTAMKQTITTYRKLLKVKQVMPWDNRYARHLRAKQAIDLDKVFPAKRLLPVLFQAYKEMGFDLRSLNIEMDLFPRPQKNQHAYCFDIDPPHDIRILANVGQAGERPYETLFHEMGHAVHGKFVRQSIATFRALPEEGFLNEGSANFFGNLVNTRRFYKTYLKLTPAQLAKVTKMKQNFLPQRLYLIRWTLLWMYFERDLYTTHANATDPTPQFWKRYAQMMGDVPSKPPAYWGILIHFVSHPIYYQNYLLADMLAAQLHEAAKRITKHPSVLQNPKIASFLRERFFRHGRFYQWDELLKRITGQSLNAKAYLNSLRTAWKQ